MWVVTLGPFRGRRIRILKLVGVILLFVLLLVLAWQGLNAVMPSEVTSTTASCQENVPTGPFARMVEHLRLWYKSGY